MRMVHVAGHNTLSASVSKYGELEPAHYEYLKSLGFTHIESFVSDWGRVELDRYQPGVYDPWYLSQLRKHIDLAYQAGLYSVVRPRVQFDDTGAFAWSGWARNDMVNYRPDYPKPLPEVTEDLLQRYLNYLTYLIDGLNDLPGFDALDPLTFPYHRSSSIWTEEELRPRIAQLNSVTLPTIIGHCDALTDRLLLVDPVHEGTKRVQGYPTYWSLPCGRYGPFTFDGYGWDETDAPTPPQLDAENIAYVFTSYANHRVDYQGAVWDYDPNYWRLGFEVGKAFQDRWNVPFIHIEGNSLVIHGTDPIDFNERPIRQDRLDMLNQFMGDCSEWPGNWLCYEYGMRIDQPSIGGQISHEIIDDAYTQPPPVNPQIAQILAEHIHTTPVSPLNVASGLVGVSMVGLGTYALSRNVALSVLMAAFGGLGGTALTRARAAPKGLSWPEGLVCQECGALLEVPKGTPAGSEVICPRCEAVYETTIL